MYILLIFYILFLLVYAAFNAYILFRVNTIRIKGDVTNRGIIIYLVAIGVIIAISFILIGSLNWHQSLTGGKIGL